MRDQWDDLRRPNPTDAELADTLEHVRSVRRRKIARAEQRTRMQFAATYKHAGNSLLDSPEVQPVIARIGAACGEMADDIDRVAYVKAIALDVLAAQMRPRCPQGESRGGAGANLDGRSAGAAEGGL